MFFPNSSIVNLTTNIISIFLVSVLGNVAASGNVALGQMANPNADGRSIDQLLDVIPQQPVDFDQDAANRVGQLTAAIERETAAQTWTTKNRVADNVYQSVIEQIKEKKQIDRVLDQLLGHRVTFAEQPPSLDRQNQIKNYLRITQAMIDLSGQLRYLLRDSLNNSTYVLTPTPDLLLSLIEQLKNNDLELGGLLMTYVLFDPPATSRARPFPDHVKSKVLELLALTKPIDALYDLSRFIQSRTASPALRLQAAQTIQQIGLPQTPIPHGRSAAPSTEKIDAGQLLEIVKSLDTRLFDSDQMEAMSELTKWLSIRESRGVLDEVYRVGKIEVRSGDWLLIRNPSPYNSFTSLGTGLFTHVGVVAARVGADGQRRFVVTEMPERLDRIPETNVEDYLERTLHYVFLRHQDVQVAQRMGEVAGSLVGRPTQFDLTFETKRVSALKGNLPDTKIINTYCAGFLLLCAQETGRPRSDFFPIQEAAPGDFFADNLKVLGLSIGDHFVSPTGALMSNQMKLIGRSQPMYSPDREIKESIYDHFAAQMIQARLTPSPNGYQVLREKLARVSKTNPWLARSLAKANNVSSHLDLEAAAKAAAVVETLDEIVEQNADAFFEAKTSMTAGPMLQLRRNYPPEDVAIVRKYRAMHPDLFRQWEHQQINPRDLRVELVKFYQRQGKVAIDRRFFQQN